MPVEDLDLRNSAIEKHVRFAEEVTQEPKTRANKIALKWKCNIANHKEYKRVRQQSQRDKWNAMRTGIIDSRASS